MRIPENTIEEILQRANIVDVAQSFHMELKKAGDNTFKACCPFHNEKTPSF
ncbi:MAG: CHC2 zinc finger domain-containing protein, partial [Lentisphaeria bacterium]|nr:CHC2 zinc finger domain-containing protein [Lentisphaeria bacterium]